MLKVYNLMALGLAITGVAAYGTYALAPLIRHSPSLSTVLPEVGRDAGASCAGVLPELPHQFMSVSAAQTTFWVYAALMGLSLSSIFLVFTGRASCRRSS